MLLQLSEVLVCPNCGPPHPVVVRVDELEGRRVREGHLGCFRCETRFPIRRGEAWLGEELAGGVAPAAAPAPPELALEAAALLDAGAATGFLLLGEGLAGVADVVARLAPSAAVIALGAGPAPAGGQRAAVGGEVGAEAEEGGRGWAPPSRLRGVPSARLPFRSGRLAGVALFRGAGATLGEAARVLGRGGRLVVLRPPPGLAGRVAELSLQLLAAESRALVARRP